jgi:hypothetical protein
LAAWLVGLILTNTGFLTAATKIESPSWASGVLVIAAIVNVPLFLTCLFLLQTRFRPELQEDVFYSRYLETRISAQTGKPEVVAVSGRSTGVLLPLRTADIARPLSPGAESQLVDKISVNDLLLHSKEIMARLQEENLEISSTFGSSSITPYPPEKFVISIGPHFSIEIFQKILRISIKNGLEGLQLVTDVFQTKKLYIGAYNYEPYSVITEQLNKLLLSNTLTWTDLRKLILSSGPASAGVVLTPPAG